MHDSATVAAADIARLAGVGRAAVSNWRRRFDDFPSPVAGTSSSPLFSLAAVEEWLRRQGKLAEVPLDERVWQQLRASVDDLRLADAVGQAGVFLTSSSAEGPLPDGLADLATSRGPARTFDFLYERYLETHSRRVAVTSGEVADLMVALADVAGGSSVLDPACGFGTLLVSAAASGATKLYGQEREQSSAVIAESRLRLHGHDSIVLTGDALRDDMFDSLQADAVVCTPPFGERSWGYEELSSDIRWTYGLPPRGEPELPWVQHGLFHVRPGGHVVILMPSAAADRRSGRRIRAQLLRSGALRAVVALPAGSAPGALGSPHLWVLRKPGGGDPIPTHVLMVDAADLPWSKVHEHVIDSWQAFRSSTEMDGAVPIIDVLDEIVDLTPGRYIGGQAAEGHGFMSAVETLSVLLEDLRRTLDDLRTLQIGGEPLPRTTIAEQIKAGALVVLTGPRLEIHSGKIPVLTLDDVLARRAPTGRTTPSTEMLTVESGDIVVPAGGRFLAVHVIDEGHAILGPGLQILRAAPDRLDPACLAGFLRIAALQSPGRGQTGTSRSDIRRIEIPRISLQQQRALGEVFGRVDRFEVLLGQAASGGSALVGLVLQGLGEGVLHPYRATLRSLLDS
ncbi:SAM-dependent methyltransferase [Planotetraspora sp. A-T 1434]|uniref:SAM-dependent methyltransferase n=1 Tax=Planotetraspora sp. A-T 1434 TaxID=2979219 RepID=UPI0021C1289A|nr:SAM-dependent methyltransferase [Planotetraspora sp. A-T 1434]MCT9934560.1 SAM-dependent methyltransferase [Planotetraspora sp. A-T 1434]